MYGDLNSHVIFLFVLSPCKLRRLLFEYLLECHLRTLYFLDIQNYQIFIQVLSTFTICIRYNLCSYILTRFSKTFPWLRRNKII